MGKWANSQEREDGRTSVQVTVQLNLADISVTSRNGRESNNILVDLKMTTIRPLLSLKGVEGTRVS